MHQALPASGRQSNCSRVWPAKEPKRSPSPAKSAIDCSRVHSVCTSMAVSQSADQQLALVDQFRRKMSVEQDEQFLVINYVPFPSGAVDGLEFVEGFLRKL